MSVKTFGLDIGTTSIKAVALKKDAGKLSVDAVAVSPFTAKNILSESQTNQQMIASSIKEMLEIAHQATKAGSIERVLSLAGNMAGVIPGSTDKIDFDYALDKYSALLNNDPKMMRTADEVAKIREDRAHQEQAAQQAAIAEQLARGAKTLAQADRKSTRLNSSHRSLSRMPSSA